jgi:hypothetical protein
MRTTTANLQRTAARPLPEPDPELISYSFLISHEMLFAHERPLCAKSGPSRNCYSPIGFSLLYECLQSFLRRIGHGNIAEILHRVCDATAVIEIDLSHEGCTAHAHDRL